MVAEKAVPWAGVFIGSSPKSFGSLPKSFLLIFLKLGERSRGVWDLESRDGVEERQ